MNGMMLYMLINTIPPYHSTGRAWRKMGCSMQKRRKEEEVEPPDGTKRSSWPGWRYTKQHLKMATLYRYALWKDRHQNKKATSRDRRSIQPGSFIPDRDTRDVFGSDPWQKNTSRRSLWCCCGAPPMGLPFGSGPLGAYFFRAKQ